MRLYHITPRTNLAAIEREGLDPQRAAGRRKVVWIAHASQLTNLLDHIAAHQNVDPRSLVILQLFLPAQLVKRHRLGIYSTRVLIPSGRIAASITACSFMSKKRDFCWEAWSLYEHGPYQTQRGIRHETP